MSIKRIACPSCGGSDFNHDDKGNLICAYCGAVFESPREEIPCRVCGTVNPPEARRCMNCGSTLGKQCPICLHINPPGAEFCEQCANPLDTLTSITGRVRDATDGSGVLRSERLTASKQTDTAYMAEQGAKLQAEERERQQRIAAQMQRARQEQMRILAIGLGVVGLIILGVAIVLLVMR